MISLDVMKALGATTRGLVAVVLSQAAWTVISAAVLALIPAVLFFIFIQRYLVQGLTAGAVKG